jgi:hypothetical protein
MTGNGRVTGSSVTLIACHHARTGSPGPRDHDDYFDQEPDATGHKNQNAKKNSEEPGGGEGMVVGLPHCEVTTTKEATARRTPMPIVIRTGSHETFGVDGPGSIRSSFSGGATMGCRLIGR